MNVSLPKFVKFYVMISDVTFSNKDSPLTLEDACTGYSIARLAFKDLGKFLEQDQKALDFATAERNKYQAEYNSILNSHLYHEDEELQTKANNLSNLIDVADISVSNQKDLMERSKKALGRFEDMITFYEEKMNELPE